MNRMKSRQLGRQYARAMRGEEIMQILVIFSNSDGEVLDFMRGKRSLYPRVRKILRLTGKFPKWLLSDKAFVAGFLTQLNEMRLLNLY